MNPFFTELPEYPMGRLATLERETPTLASLPQIRLSIGEPRHPTPEVITQALAAGAGRIDAYPDLWGGIELRTAVANWIARRHAPAKVDPATEVLVVNGVREGLYSLANAVIDGTRGKDSYVVCPNPGYQVYDGAATMLGVGSWFVDLSQDRAGEVYRAIPEQVLRNTQLLFVCTPENPTGKVHDLAQWKTLFELSDRYGFLLVSDECYSEIYYDEAKPPLGALAAAQQLGRGLERLVVFGSLSKRSNAPGLRSGFITGDAAVLKRLYQLRSYNGGGMSNAVQAASIAAWNDERHTIENRAKYACKMEHVLPILRQVLEVDQPEAGFFLWARLPDALRMSDLEFTRVLMREQNVVAMPGSFLARTVNGVNPAAGRLRLAMVAEPAQCVEAAERIVACCRAALH